MRIISSNTATYNRRHTLDKVPISGESNQQEFQIGHLR